MEQFHSRRNRRGRRGLQNDAFLPPTYPQAKQPQAYKGSSLIQSLFSTFVLASLITLIYLMLEYHCSVCRAKGELKNITRSIEDISINLDKVNLGYQDLELKVNRFSEELPKLQYQMHVLESIAKNVQRQNNFLCKSRCQSQKEVPTQKPSIKNATSENTPIKSDK